MHRRTIAAFAFGTVALAVGVWQLALHCGPHARAPAATLPRSANAPIHGVALPQSPTSSTALRPGPRPAVDLGPGQPLTLPTHLGQTAHATIWPAARGNAPILLALSAQGEQDRQWLSVLRLVRAQRPTTLVIVAAPPAADIGEPLVAARDHLDAVLDQLEARTAFAGAAVALLAGNEAAVAALDRTAVDLRVRATVALSLPVQVTDTQWSERMDNLQRRQLFLAWSKDDPHNDPGILLSRRLVNKRLALADGCARGVQLLDKTRVRSDLAGWLFAALGPAQ